MKSHVYSSTFYDYIDDGSRRSAKVVTALLLGEFSVESLLDVGAGHGAWAAQWIDAGVPDVLAVDGSYVDRSRLAIDVAHFHAHDLEQPLDLGRRFDLVQSLEVAEHLPALAADTFVQSLVRHGDIVLFSAAVPHQGGEHHVNEQPPEYWRAKFAAHDYTAFDWLRPKIAGEGAIMPWYRFNSILYANAAGISRLSAAIRHHRVPESVPLRIGGNIGWTLRRAVVRMIPAPLVKQMAVVKSRVQTGWQRASI